VKLLFSGRSWETYLYWQGQDPDVVDKINALIKDAMRSSFVGIGKPEPLKNELKGWWSRRITQEHRLVYRVTGAPNDQTLEIASCRFHY